MDREKELLEACEKRWEVDDSDPRIKFFEDNLLNFLEEFDEKEIVIIKQLLEKFDYFSHSKINGCLSQLHQKVCAVDEYDEGTTIFCVLKTLTGKINSSTEYLVEYWRLNKINKYSVITNVNDVPKEAWDYIENVVFVDDICGTGDTLEKYLNSDKCPLEIKSKNIIYAVVFVMDSAVEKIKKLCDKKGYNIKVEWCEKAIKAFDNGVFDKNARDTFRQISRKVDIRNMNNDVYGYKKSEALVSFYNNTPNNTLGVFRKTTLKNNPLFPRLDNEEKPQWLAKTIERKKNRKVEDYCRGVNEKNG